MNPSRRHCSTWAASWARRCSSPAWARRTDPTGPMVIASAPGGTGPPTHSTCPARRVITSSVQPQRQLLAVARGARIVGAQQLEQVDELLAGVVVLHPIEQRVEPGLDV